jgi:hypothetical protein
VREREAELAFERRVAEETKAVRDRLDTTYRERAQLEVERLQQRDAEHAEQRRQLERKIDELRQRLQQGSMQVQGEAQEVSLSTTLAAAFRDDRIEDVPRGAAGADLLQRVYTTDRRACGTIIWESKRTQHWSDAWLQKLRDDKRASGAACAVIVSQALPPHIRGFGEIDGVWVCSWAYAVPVAHILRAWLVELAAVNLAAEGADTKGRRLHAYLTGQEFRNRFEGILEAYREMRGEIDREKRAFTSSWKRREVQLDRALANLGAFHGDLQAIAGASFATLEAFALPDPAADADGDGAPDAPRLALVAQARLPAKS